MYLTGRVVAGTAGLVRLDRELRSIDPELAGFVLPQGEGYDRAGIGLGTLALLQSARRSRRAAEAYADRWLKLVDQQRAVGEWNPYEAATRLAEPRLKLAAATENAEAFNTARQQAIEKLTAARVGIELVRVWNAVLDKRTCERCSRLDGKWVLIGERFPDGDAPLHNRCRCHDEITPRNWVEMLDAAA